MYYIKKIIQIFLRNLMVFDVSEGSPIDKNIAAAWTRNFREVAPTGLHGHFFSRELLIRLLNQDGCTGIRFYYGLRDGVQQLFSALTVTAFSLVYLDQSAGAGEFKYLFLSLGGLVFNWFLTLAFLRATRPASAVPNEPGPASFGVRSCAS